MTEVGSLPWQKSGGRAAEGASGPALPFPLRRPAEAGVEEDPGETPGDLSSTAFTPSAGPVHAGFFCWEVATGRIHCDALTFRLHGLPEDSPPHLDSFLSRIPETDLAKVVGALRSMAESGGDYQIAYRVAAGEGIWRSLEARGRVLADAAGIPICMVGLVMDTTADQQRQEAERRRFHEGANRNRRVQELTAALAAAVTVKDIMAAAQAGLQAFGADGLAVLSAASDGVSAVVSHDCGDAMLAAVRAAQPGAPSPLADVLVHQGPVFARSLADLAESYPHLARAAERSRHRAWAMIPMVDSRGPAGSCLIGFDSPREFCPEERALLVAVAGLLAQSLERARMYESEHELATELQRGMLPPGPLTAPGLTIAARYQAATSGMWIGGDWYDAIPLPDGAVALVIGDVQGHSVHAASLMGRLRTAVHAYAYEGHGPAAVLERTNRLLVDFDPDPDKALFATCCYLLIRPAEGTIEACRAGHPAPVLVAPGEPPRLLDIPGGLPLGVDPEARYPTHVVSIRPGSVLAVTTDGLLEAPEGDIDLGTAAFLARLAGAVTTDLEALADDLLAGISRAPHRGDDIALLLARLTDPSGI